MKFENLLHLHIFKESTEQKYFHSTASVLSIWSTRLFSFCNTSYSTYPSSSHTIAASAFKLLHLLSPHSNPNAKCGRSNLFKYDNAGTRSDPIKGFRFKSVLVRARRNYKQSHSTERTRRGHQINNNMQIRCKFDIAFRSLPAMRCFPTTSHNQHTHPPTTGPLLLCSSALRFASPDCANSEVDGGGGGRDRLLSFAEESLISATNGTSSFINIQQLIIIGRRRVFFPTNPQWMRQ